jgi:hypothetical protein
VTDGRDARATPHPRGIRRRRSLDAFTPPSLRLRLELRAHVGKALRVGRVGGEIALLARDHGAEPRGRLAP